MKKISTFTLVAWAAAALLGACGGSGGGGQPPVSGEEEGPPPVSAEPEAPVPPETPPEETEPKPPAISPNGLAICGTGPGGEQATNRIEPCETLPLETMAATGKNRPRPRAAAQHTAVVQLEPLVEEAKAASASAGGALQIGVPRPVGLSASSAATRALLHWQPTGDGAQVAALRFASPAAHGVRLGVLVEHLPAGAVLRAYGEAKSEVVEISAAALGDMMARNARDEGATGQSIQTWWSPDFGGDSTTLEVEIPAGARAQEVRLAVPRIAHHTLDVDAALWRVQPKDVGDAASCHVDAVCRPETHLERRSVARMIYMKADGKGYLCTGTLLNNTQNDGRPYLLSANHCVNTNSEASSLITDWFFHASECGSGLRNPQRVRVSGGATLRSTWTGTDMTLLELNQAPPPGVVYAGSFFGDAPSVGSALSSVHHPAGDLQKFSAGDLRGVGSCSINPGSGSMGCTPAGDTFWVARWQQGSAEGGSSGSALLLRQGGMAYVIGQLSGGQTVCTPGALDFYGRLDKAWPRLQGWLAPQ